MEEGKPSRATTEALDSLYATLLTVNPDDRRGEEIFAEVMRQLDVVTSARRDRLVMAAGIVPMIIWLALFGGAILTVAFTFFFGTENLRAQTLMTGALAALIFAGLLTIVTIDRPFTGSVKVKPEAFVTVLDDFAGATRP